MPILRSQSSISPPAAGPAAADVRSGGRGLRSISVTVATLALAAGGAHAQGYRLYVSNEYDADISVIDPASGAQAGTIKISGRPGDVRLAREPAAVMRRLDAHLERRRRTPTFN